MNAVNLNLKYKNLKRLNDRDIFLNNYLWEIPHTKLFVWRNDALLRNCINDIIENFRQKLWPQKASNRYAR